MPKAANCAESQEPEGLVVNPNKLPATSILWPKNSFHFLEAAELGKLRTSDGRKR
jgi:hypothetical protein